MSEEVNHIESVSVIRYVAIFSAIYAGLMIVVQILVHGFDIGLPSSVNIGMLVGAGLSATMRFVNENNRPPIESEEGKLIWLSLFSAYVISIVIGTALLFIIGGYEAFNEISQLFNELPMAAWAGIIFAVTIMYYVLLRVNYGWGAKFYYERQSKNKM